MNDQRGLFDELGGNELKRLGMDKVLSSDVDYPTMIRELLAGMLGQELIGEDIRLAALRAGAPQPHHPNVWGASISAVRHQGWLRPTGAWRKPRDPSSHARPTQVYLVVDPRRKQTDED
jgi:hypothetical protein